MSGINLLISTGFSVNSPRNRTFSDGADRLVEDAAGILTIDPLAAHGIWPLVLFRIVTK